MKPEDFDMYDDPRVRAVFAAAARVCEVTNTEPLGVAIDALRTALFAAQHSKPKEPPSEPCEVCGLQEPSPNPCGGDHGNSYECHACVAGRKV